MSAVDRLLQHARAHGTEEVFEAVAAELSEPDRARLAQGLRHIDPAWSPAGAWARWQPAAELNGRSCSWCGGPLSGRADRRTCSLACRVAAHRAVQRAATKAGGQGITPGAARRCYSGDAERTR